jgi:hypothetical protein
MGKPTECVFCAEAESINHLFFDCTVSVLVWREVSTFFGFTLGNNYLSAARFWLSNKKHLALNTICAAVLWSIWKSRNALIFDNQTWISMKQIWWLILKSLRKWRLIYKASMTVQIDLFCSKISKELAAPCAI